VRLPYSNGKGPSKTTLLWLINFLLIIYFLPMFFQALDNFTTPIPGFEGDIPIPAILISARTPSIESAHNSSAGPSAGSSRTRAGKRKAKVTSPPPKTSQKVVNKKASGVKINDLAPNPSPAPTPLKTTRSRFTMRRSNR
jgi:hypothetical protein